MSNEITVIDVGDVEILEETPFDKEFRESAQRERERKFAQRVSSAPQNKLANAINECNLALGKIGTSIENTKDELSVSKKRLKRYEKAGGNDSRVSQVKMAIRRRTKLIEESKVIRKNLNKRLKYLLDLQAKIDEL